MKAFFEKPEYCSDKGGCPFANTDESKQIQKSNCLPTKEDIIKMRVEDGKTWSCHKDRSKPCLGAIKFLKENNLPYKVINKDLVKFYESN